MMNENESKEIIIGCAIKVHKSLGPESLESAHEEYMDYELRKAILKVERQKPAPLIYEEVKLDYYYRLDFMANKKVNAEIKSTKSLDDIHLTQMLTYLRLSEYKVGLFINFNVLELTIGIKKVVDNYLFCGSLRKLLQTLR